LGGEEPVDVLKDGGFGPALVGQVCRQSSSAFSDLEKVSAAALS